MSRCMLCAVGVLLSVGSAFGQTAGMLSFQGLIKDGGGTPITGTVNLEFRIYDALTAGNLVDMDGDGTVEDVIGEDTKQVLSVTATDGVLSTKFGPVSPKAFDGTPRWLEVRVDGTPLSRVEMATAPAGGGVCGPGNGDCCNLAGNGTPGCDDPECCNLVCGVDPFCCDPFEGFWDGVCAGQAAELCGNCAPVTLTVGSKPTGVAIAVTPNDVNGVGNGTTPFARLYTRGTVVCLTAPMTQGTKMFLRWELDGNQLPFGKTKATITMSADHSAEAIYQCPVTDTTKIVCCAVDILDKCFGGCVPAQVDGKNNGPSGKRIIKCLKKMKDKWHGVGKNIKKVKNLGAIGEASGDKTKNCTDKDMIKLCKDDFPANKCDKNFALLINTFYHEGTHATQDWNDCTKEGVAKDELPAYINDKKVSAKLIAAIKKIKANRVAMNPDTDGLEPCLKSFTNCKTDELSAMLKVIEADNKFVCKQITKFAKVIGAVPGRSLRPLRGPPIVVTLAERFYATSFPSAERAAFPTIIDVNDVQSSVLLQSLFTTDPETESLLDTGIARVLDLAVIENTSGDEVLLVLGTTQGYESGGLASGVIKAYEDLDSDGFFDIASEAVLVAGDTALQSASNLTQDPVTLNHYVYDPILRTLRLLDDTDADGVPDTLTGPSIILDDPALLAEMAIVQFATERLEARIRFGDPAQGDVDIVVFSDGNDDGFYESGVRGGPSQLDVRNPTACTFPFIGNTTMGLFGSPEHMLRVDEVMADGTFIQTLTTGTVPGGENDVFVTFPAPLTAGMFMQIVDLTNTLTSNVFPTRTPEPVLYEADVTEGPLGGGTVVTYTGENLPTVTAVQFGGVSANIVSQNNSTVVVESPPGLLEQDVDVEFLLSVGGPLIATGFTYAPPLPPQPIADAGPDQSVSFGGSPVDVVLDGSGSVPGGVNPITDYVWTGNMLGGIASGVSPTVTFTSAGDHKVVLIVSDGQRNSDPKTTVIHVVSAGCGACQLHGDVFPFVAGDPNANPVGNCVVDLDDVLTVLASFSSLNQCGPDFPDTVNLFPCAQACPAGVVDLDDILSTLSAFSGTYDCPHPCSGGACCFGDSTCQDWDAIAPGTTPVGGMSQSTCNTAGGNYQGDGTTCGDVTCP